MTLEKIIEARVTESNDRMMHFENEPSYWNGMLVYEAGDIEGYHEWLRTALEEVAAAAREEVIRDLRK